MCRVVLIAAATERSDGKGDYKHKLNDIVEVQEDGHIFGPSYDSFRIYDLPGVPRQKFQDDLELKLSAEQKSSDAIITYYNLSNEGALSSMDKFTVREYVK
jgi:hypothetical protein